LHEDCNFQLVFGEKLILLFLNISYSSISIKSINIENQGDSGVIELQDTFMRAAGTVLYQLAVTINSATPKKVR